MYHYRHEGKISCARLGAQIAQHLPRRPKRSAEWQRQRWRTIGLGAVLVWLCLRLPAPESSTVPICIKPAGANVIILLPNLRPSSAFEAIIPTFLTKDHAEIDLYGAKRIMVVLPRQSNYNDNDDCYQDAYGRVQCYNSAWNNWVRWLVLAIIIVAAFLIFFLFSCITARRRRRHGIAPYRGTGWTLGRTPPGHAPATYYGGNNGAQNAQPYYNNSNQPYPQQQYQPPNSNVPPPYSPAPNNSYYGQNPIELQQPSSTYQGYRSGEEQYAPPKSPPPGHKDHVIR